MLAPTTGQQVVVLPAVVVTYRLRRLCPSRMG